MTVVHILMNIRVIDQYKMFPEKKHKVFLRSRSHPDLFSLLNLYWNYLAYDLLDELVRQLTQNERSFKTISEDMLTYKTDLQKFRQHTELKLFCQMEVSDNEDDSTEEDPPPGFSSYTQNAGYSYT